MARQLRLGLGRPGAFSFDEFVPGPSNADALAALARWPDWPGGVVALVGPEAAGKTHLSAAWSARSGAVVLERERPDTASASERPVLLEDVDRGAPDEALFHLINLAARSGRGLLLTARTPPLTWPAALPDLRSRLNALFVATLEPPDDVVLEGLLRRFFRERSITPAEEVYPYLLRRMPRSAPGAREIVRRLDEAGEAVTRASARKVLEADDENLDLFP